MNSTLVDPSLPTFCTVDQIDQECTITITIPYGAPECIDLASYLAQFTGAVVNLVLRIAAGKKVTIEHNALEPRSLVIKSITYQLEAHATVYIKEYQRHTVVQRCTIVAAEYSTCEYQGVILQAGQATTEFIILLEGPGSTVRVSLVPLVADTHALHITSLQQHMAAHTTSSFLVRGFVKDQGLVHCTGTVQLTAAAHGADAVQKSAFLLDGHQARAYARPVLEALTHTVRCVHGSAIGQIAEECLMYLQSRGINKVSAQHVVVQGFLEELLDTTGKNLIHTYLHHD
jgi:Fe-S cluster assembly scaffold protein SufB